jgi:hypothetical protein
MQVADAGKCIVPLYLEYPMTAQMQDIKQEEATDWQPQADMVLSALEAASWADDRRKQPRIAYRVKATLKLFADGSDEPARILYTRDVNHRGIGFVTRDRLPLGYGGILNLPSPQAPTKMLSIQCTLFRCRPAASGWYEGALQFNRDQWEFMAENTSGDLPGNE